MTALPIKLTRWYCLELKIYIYSAVSEKKEKNIN